MFFDLLLVLIGIIFTHMFFLRHPGSQRPFFLLDQGVIQIEGFRIGKNKLSLLSFYLFSLP